MTSRRHFLAQVSAAGALIALPSTDPRRWLASPAALLPDPDEALLSRLALLAVEAARVAGAGFADVRMTTGQGFVVASRASGGKEPDNYAPVLRSTSGYGVRALVDGAWGFAGGYDLKDDRVAAVAREAVAVARANRARQARTIELAPTPVVRDGRWQTPIERDPFTVSFQELTDLVVTAVTAAGRVNGVNAAECQLNWDRLYHVFASTEGSLIVQRLDEARPQTSVTATAANPDYQTARGAASAPGVRGGGYGYEAVVPEQLPAAMVAAAELAIEEAKAARRPRSVDVGRYDLVLSANAVADLLNDSLARALDLERALGYRANGAGTSYAAPPSDMLGGRPIASKLITLTGERSDPHAYATVGWDDEGVAPESYTFMREGVIQDYHTNRQMAPHLAEWYGRAHRPVRSHGDMRGVGLSVPCMQLPNMTLTPGRGATSLDDLIAGTTRGFYVDSVGGGVDHQLMTGQYRCAGAREIVRGKLGQPIKDMALQFVTGALWKSVDAIGGAASAQATRGGGLTRSGDPIYSLMYRGTSTFTAVPARVRQVNILNTGRTA